MGLGCADDVLPQASSGRGGDHSWDGLERVEGEIGRVAIVIVSRVLLLGECLVGMGVHIGGLLLMVALKAHLTCIEDTEYFLNVAIYTAKLGKGSAYLSFLHSSCNSDLSGLLLCET